MKPPFFLAAFLFASAPVCLPAAVNQPFAAVAQLIAVRLSESLLKTSRSPEILGTGQVRVDVVIDGKVLSTASFEIKKG